MNEYAWDLLPIEVERINFSRIFNYWLGGYHNFEIDRITAERIESLFPSVRLAAFANRAFLKRCLRYLCGQGINQFLDIGSGIQTTGGVHEFLERIDPDARIVYVDVDPVVVEHNNSILKEKGNVRTLLADAREIDLIIENKDVAKYLNFSRPIAILFSNILHSMEDDDTVHEIIANVKRSIPLGSYLIIVHISLTRRLDRMLQKVKKMPNPMGMQLKSRSHSDIYNFFKGFKLVYPGLVYAPLWRPEGEFDVLIDAPELSIALAGVGKKTRDAQ